jgi:hypothetical protein
MIAMRRASMPPLPGRANSDSAGDDSTSGRGARSSTFGNASGTSKPSPAATRSASSSVTLRRPATMRLRIATVCTFVSSKRNAFTMCAFSTSVWLFQKSRAWL